MKNINLAGNDILCGSLLYGEHEEYFLGCNTDEQFNQELLLFKQLTRDKKTLIDVGSAYGWFSLIFCSDESKTAFAFDGAPHAYLIVQQLKLLNNMDNLVLFRSLIGAEDGLLGVVYDRFQSLVAFDAENTGFDALELVLTLDSVCETYDLVPDVIKIDVEGYEYNVLLGAEVLINNYKPMIFMEVHPKMLKYHGHNIYHVIDFFNTTGYIAYDHTLTKIEDYKSHLEQEENDSNRTIWTNTNLKTG